MRSGLYQNHAFVKSVSGVSGGELDEIHATHSRCMLRMHLTFARKHICTDLYVKLLQFPPGLKSIDSHQSPALFIKRG